MKADIPPNERERLLNLQQYNILDSEREEEYNDLVLIASRICGAPVSMISFIDEDRQWYKSTLGIDPGMNNFHREVAFCAHTILDPGQPLVVNDMREDPRFSDNPFVTGEPRAVFYAGAPLVTREGYPLGSICVLDLQPRELNEEQVEALASLSRQVVKLLELRRTLAETERSHQVLLANHLNLREFSQVVAHDLKAPLRSIRQYTALLREEHGDCLNADGHHLLDTLSTLSLDAQGMVQGVFRYSVAISALTESAEIVDLNATMGTILTRLRPAANATVTFDGPVEKVISSRVALEQILQNLVGNALKFADKPQKVVRVSCQASPGGHTFSVADNGPGIPSDKLTTIFSMFYTTSDGEKTEGHGIGLTIVRRLVEILNGTVRVESVLGHGSTFFFTIAA